MKCSLLTLSAFLDDEVDARKRGEVEAHLVACDRCSRGLTHLREESDRVSLLAQVHVADHSAHALMEQVGIIDPGIQLPMKTNASVTVIREDTLPWLTAGTGRAALPWKPQRAVPTAMPAPATPSEVRSAPAAQDEGESSDGSSPSTWNDTSDQYVVDEPTEPINTESEEQPPKPAAQPWFPPGTTAESLTADPRLPLVTSPPRAEPPRPQPPPAPPTPPASAVEFVPHPPAQAPPAVPDDLPEVPVAATPAPDIPSTPVVEQPALAFRPEPTSAAPPQTSIYDEPVDDPNAHDEIPVVQDEIPEPRAPEPIFTPAASPPLPPVRAARPSGFMARVRDAIAVRRAVRSLPDDDSVDMFNGEITPSINHPRRSGPPRDEAVQERRLQAAAAAAAPENTESVRDELEIKPEVVSEPEPVPEPEPLYPREPVAPPEPVRVPEPIHPTDPPPVWEPTPEVPVAAFEDETSLHDLREQALKPPRPSFGASRKPPGLRARSLQTRIPSFDKRLLLVGAVALLVLVIGLATGKSSKVASPASASHSTPANSVSATHTSTTSATASATPHATPTGTSVALTNTHTVGNGGTGYAVDDVRYGQHTGFFRIVFDLSGGKGLPTVVVGFKNPTTMDVVFTGATPSNATGVLPNTRTVTKVTILPRTTSGQTVYEFTLAHAVTVKPVYYVGPPVHLILDLS
jgi:hypothetical protein